MSQAASTIQAKTHERSSLMNHDVKRRIKGSVMTGIMYACAAFTVLLLVGLLGYIFVKGLPEITWQLLSTKPSVLRDTIGILPNILNTLYIILLTVVIALPLGVGAAVYLTEYSKNPRFSAIIEFATETLAGIPSIIYGLVGMLVFVQILGFGTSLLSGSLTLVIMILPTIIRTTQESLKTVPQSYREGALGLGATKWHMIRTIILPCSLPGIVTGCILSIGRIVGERRPALHRRQRHHHCGQHPRGFHARRRHTLGRAVYLRRRARRIRGRLCHCGYPAHRGLYPQLRGQARPARTVPQVQLTRYLQLKEPVPCLILKSSNRLWNPKTCICFMASPKPSRASIWRLGRTRSPR